MLIRDNIGAMQNEVYLSYPRQTFNPANNLYRPIAEIDKIKLRFNQVLIDPEAMDHTVNRFPKKIHTLERGNNALGIEAHFLRRDTDTGKPFYDYYLIINQEFFNPRASYLIQIAYALQCVCACGYFSIKTPLQDNMEYLQFMEHITEVEFYFDVEPDKLYPLTGRYVTCVSNTAIPNPEDDSDQDDYSDMNAEVISQAKQMEGLIQYMNTFYSYDYIPMQKRSTMKIYRKDIQELEEISRPDGSYADYNKAQQIKNHPYKTRIEYTIRHNDYGQYLEALQNFDGTYLQVRNNFMPLLAWFHRKYANLNIFYYMGANNIYDRVIEEVSKIPEEQINFSNRCDSKRKLKKKKSGNRVKCQNW